MCPKTVYSYILLRNRQPDLEKVPDGRGAETMFKVIVVVVVGGGAGSHPGASQQSFFYERQIQLHQTHLHPNFNLSSDLGHYFESIRKSEKLVCTPKILVK